MHEMPCPEEEDAREEERADGEPPARGGKGIQHVVNSDNDPVPCGSRLRAECVPGPLRGLKGVKAVPRRGDLGPLYRLGGRPPGTQLADPAAHTRNRKPRRMNPHMRKIPPTRR